MVRPVSWHPCLFAHEAFFFRTVCPIRLGGGSRVRQHNINGSVVQKSHSHILYVVRMFPPPPFKKNAMMNKNAGHLGPGVPENRSGIYRGTTPILQVGGPHSGCKARVSHLRRDDFDLPNIQHPTTPFPVPICWARP